MSAVHAGTRKWGQIIGSHSQLSSTESPSKERTQVFKRKKQYEKVDQFRFIRFIYIKIIRF